MALSYTLSGGTPATTWGTAGTAVVPNGSYKDVTDASASAGDLLVAIGLSEGYTYSGGTRSVATQSGSTGTWTEYAPSPTYGDDCEAELAWATVSSTGSVTARVTQRTTTPNGGYDHIGSALLRVPAAEWSGAPSGVASFAGNATGAVSCILPSGSTYTVVWIGADWSAGTGVSAVTPSGGTVRTSYVDSGHYTANVITWTGQTAGTRNYGPSGLSGRDFTGVVAIIPEASGGTAYTKAVADTAGLTDAASKVATGARTQSDAAGLTDATSRILAGARAQADTAGLTDAVSARLAWAMTVADSLGITDDVVVVFADSGTATDLVGLVDQVTAVLSSGGVAYTKTVGDTVGATDAVTFVFDLSRSVADTAGLSDAVTISTSGVGAKIVADLIGATDAAMVTLSGSNAAADSSGLSDGVSAAMSRRVTVADLIGAIDAADWSNVVDGIMADSSGLSDAVVAVLTRQLTFSPPTRRERLLSNHPLFRRMSRTIGVSLLKESGIYRQVIDPMAEEVEAADIAYLGGHTYVIGTAEADDLTAAGYGEWVIS